MNAQLVKVIENVYSLKKQKTLSFQIDAKIKNTAISHKRQTKIESLKVYKSLSSDTLQRLESFSIPGPRSSLSKLYKSRIMPAQYMATPADTLKKLAQQVYNPTKAKDLKPELMRIEEPVVDLNMFKQIKSARESQRDKTASSAHAYLERSCNEMLEENKKSRKMLKLATQFLNKKALFARKIAGKSVATEEKANYDDFHSKLKLAHSQLVKQDLINPRKRPVKQELHIRSFLAL